MSESTGDNPCPPEPSRGSPETTDAAAEQTRAFRKRRWIFRLLAVALSLLTLGLVEVVLRVLGTGADLSLIQPVPFTCEILRQQINPDADRAWCPGQGMAGPEPRRLDVPKPPDVFRIVVVGASTVQGFPYASELAFPRQLELLLNRHDPGRSVEVVNLGVTGISTAVVRQMLCESLALQPDLIVVHAGHNEFYGIGGVASAVGAASPLMMSTVAGVRRSRVGQIIASVLPSAVPDDRDPIESLPTNLNISQTSELVTAAENAYRRNLTAMIAIADRAHIPILLSTVAANTRFHSPVSRLLPENLDAEDLAEWRVYFDEGRRLASLQDFTGALDQFAKARRISEESSLLHYRRGECLLNLNRSAEADRAYAAAADLDGCRFRAPSSFREIVRSVAKEAPGRQVLFVDTGAAVSAAVRESGQTGSELPVFLEHVHYSRRGHAILAESLARSILDEVFQVEWVPIDVHSEEFLKSLGWLPEDDLVALSFALEIYNRSPMDQSFDVDRHRQRLLQMITSRFSSLSLLRQDVFSSLSMEQMADDLPMHLADRIQASDHHGDHHGELLKLLRTAVRRRPWNGSARQRLIRELMVQTQRDAAHRDELQQHRATCRQLGDCETNLE